MNEDHTKISRTVLKNGMRAEHASRTFCIIEIIEDNYKMYERREKKFGSHRQALRSFLFLPNIRFIALSLGLIFIYVVYTFIYFLRFLNVHFPELFSFNFLQ